MHGPRQSNRAAGYTVFKNNVDRLSKLARDNPDGSVTIESQTLLWDGEYCTEKPAGTPRQILSKIGAVLDGLGSDGAIGSGVAAEGNPPAGRIITKDKWERRGGGTDAIPRAKSHFVWYHDLAPLLLDGDDRAGLPQQLTALWPDFAKVAVLVRPSASASIAKPGTTEPLKVGEHCYVLIDEPERASDVLAAFIRLDWCRGTGALKLSIRGDMLIRGVVDAAVGSPERLSYEGEVVVRGALERLPRDSVVSGGDEVLCVNDLLAYADAHAPQAEFERRVHAAKADPETIAESDRRWAAYRGEYIETAVRHGVPRAQAEANYDRATRARTTAEGERTFIELAEDHVLYRSDGTSFMVSEVFGKLREYHDTQICDPLEGLDYHTRGCAVLYTNGGGRIEIYSRAHSDAFSYFAPFQWHELLAGLKDLAANSNDSVFAKSAAEVERLARLPPHEVKLTKGLQEWVDNVRERQHADEMAAAATSLKAEPFVLRDPRKIPERQWIYGRHLLRQFVSATIGHGGVGKSNLEIVEMLAIATGRALIGILPPQRVRVWYWNGEDPKVELERRITAACRHFEIKAEEIEGWLFVNSGKDEHSRIVVAEETKHGTMINKPVVDAVIANIRKNKIDVMIIDPFVSSHRVAENDNNAIDELVKEWARIADVCNIAIELAHHARKTGGAEVTVEDSRGAIALVNAARSARVVNVMSRDEAGKAGVVLDDRRRYFSTSNGKLNVAPPVDKRDWHYLRSVDLGNGPDGSAGDSVGVVTEWKWPDPQALVAGVDFDKVAVVIKAGSWRASSQAKDWVGKAVAQALGIDLDADANKFTVGMMVKTWIGIGRLRVVERQDERRKAKEFVEVNSA
jgi:hypothetical protein